jgi:hypothetical protein
MKALLTACTAIACAATQVSLFECPLEDALFATSRAAGCPSASAQAQRAGARPASARSAGALAVPRAPTGNAP